MIRIGYSLDSHRFKEGEGFTLGGVFIPCNFGIVAHSDGDCLLHALAESILGAVKLGSLGDNYPDNDPKYKGKDSSYFVLDAYKRANDKGYYLANVDMQIMLDKPKLKEYIPLMEEKIAKLLNCTLEQVSVKATTLEGLSDLSIKGVTCVSSILLINEK